MHRELCLTQHCSAPEENCPVCETCGHCIAPSPLHPCQAQGLVLPNLDFMLCVYCVMRLN